jgi:hypothetical protein
MSILRKLLVLLLMVYVIMMMGCSSDDGDDEDEPVTLTEMSDLVKAILPQYVPSSAIPTWEEWNSNNGPIGMLFWENHACSIYNMLNSYDMIIPYLNDNIPVGSVITITGTGSVNVPVLGLSLTEMTKGQVIDITSLNEHAEPRFQELSDIFQSMEIISAKFAYNEIDGEKVLMEITEKFVFQESQDGETMDIVFIIYGAIDGNGYITMKMHSFNQFSGGKLNGYRVDFEQLDAERFFYKSVSSGNDSSGDFDYDNFDSFIAKGKMTELLIRQKSFVYLDADVNGVVFSTGVNTSEYGDYFGVQTYSYPDFTLDGNIEGVETGSSESLLSDPSYAAYYGDQDGTTKNVKESNMLGYSTTTNNFSQDVPLEALDIEWNP